MKGMDTIARVRREFSIRGKTTKEIARELHVSRNMIGKVLRSGATSFEYRGIACAGRQASPLKRCLEGGVGTRRSAVTS